MIYFRCDASHHAGSGHLSRCLILAERLNVLVPTVFIVPKSHLEIKDIIEMRDLRVHTVPNVSTYKDEIAHYPANSKNIIVDLFHKRNMDKPEGLIAYLETLKNSGYKIALMNGLGGDAFHDNRTPEVMAYIQPYWGTENEPVPKAEHWIHGPEYVLLDEVYQNAYEHRGESKIQNVLITFGGADPQGNTVKVMKGLESLSDDVRIKVVIGKFFAKNHIKTIEEIQKTLPDKIDVIYKPKGLLDHYQWADLCICGSGMTRYEAAACGLPSLCTAIYKEHEGLSENFASYGTTKYLGFCENLSPQDWADAIKVLKKKKDDYLFMVSAIEKIRQSKSGTHVLAQRLVGMFQS